MRAYILIQSEPGRLAQIVRAVRDIRGAVAVSALAGPYDAIAEAEAGSLEELTRHVLRPIQALEGVNRTLTCPVVRL